MAAIVEKKDADIPTADGKLHSWHYNGEPIDVQDHPDAAHSLAHSGRIDNFTAMEVHLKSRCHGFQLEAVDYDITPTGMHYLLIHYDVPKIEEKGYSVPVHGACRNPIRLNMDQIRARPSVTVPITFECGGAGRVHQHYRLWRHVPWGDDAIGTSMWTGCSLADLLKEVGPLEGVKSIIFTGRDKGVEAGEVQYFQRSLTLEQAMRPEVLLVYGMNGQPLTPQHGYPLRLIVPGWLGMTNVKWIDNIEVSYEDFKGHQMLAYSRAKNNFDEDRIPLTYMRVKSVMKPPGVPEFFTRLRYLELNKEIVLSGRAWVGLGSIKSVEVSDDGGETWMEARMGAPLGEHAWLGWTFTWTPTRLGPVQLRVRATDSLGNVQSDKDESATNFYAMDVNKPQFVDCMVVEPARLKIHSEIDVPLVYPSL